MNFELVQGPLEFTGPFFFNSLEEFHTLYSAHTFGLDYRIYPPRGCVTYLATHTLGHATFKLTLGLLSLTGTF
jgi:hypothetical protein